MFERFTDRARKVMALANSEAQRFNHEYIGTEHMLLAMVKHDGSVAVNVLKNLDVDPRKVRLEVEKLIQPGPDIVTLGKLPQTPRSKIAIECAIQEARGLGHNYVGTEHLLLGLLPGDGIAGTVLRGLGLTAEEIREEVLVLVGPKAPAAQPAPAMSRAEVSEIVRRVAELPNRSSPEGWSEAMLVTGEELRRIVQDVLSPTAPNRQHLIEMATTAVYLSSKVPNHEAHIIAEAVIDHIHPELKPKPAPVEPVKTDGEKLSEQLIYLTKIGRDPQSSMFCIGFGGFGSGMGLFEVRHGEVDAVGQERRLKCAREVLATATDALLAARDTAHQADLLGFKHAMMTKLRNTFDGSTHVRERLLDAMDAVPLTAAPEARP